MNDRSIIGWDVGGAHLKAARLSRKGTLERVLQLPCPLWQGLEHLERTLDAALTSLGSADAHAVTMTGEMADLFPDRSTGVQRIAELLVQRLHPQRPAFYAGEQGFIAAHAAAAGARHIASANWHASAALVARRLPACLLLDIGSTTTDVIVVAGGRVRAQGWTDAERLASQELVYTGVVRTPLMALTRRVVFQGGWTYPMAEHFATTADVYRLSGELPPEADQHPSADQGEKSVSASARRLARMIGYDVEAADLAQWRQLAQRFADAQLAHIGAAVDRALSRPEAGDETPLVGAGCGRFLAQALARRCARRYRDFSALLDVPAGLAAAASTCAPAVAVALLHRETLSES